MRNPSGHQGENERVKKSEQQQVRHFLHKTCKGLFTWSGRPRSSGVSFFCFHALEDTKQKKLTPLDRGPPLHVNRPLISLTTLYRPGPLMLIPYPIVFRGATNSYPI